MTLPAIALRNLTRNRRRTALSLLVIAAGSVAVLLTAGFVRFSFAGLREAIIHGGLGHLEVLPAAHAGEGGVPDRSAAPALDDWRALQVELEALPHVQAAGAAVYLSGMVSRGERTAAFVGVALEPERERRMDLEVKLRGGRNLPDGAPPVGEDEVLLGLGLAKAVGAGAGDVVTLTSMTADGTLNAVDATVVGLVTTGLQELDSRLLKMHLASGERLLGTDRASSLVVGLEHTDATDAVRAAVEHHLRGRPSPLVVLDWRTRAPFYGQVRNLYAGIFWFLGLIVFVLVCLATSNTLLMSVMERMRELGTLLAIGTGRGQVAAIVILEALWLGVLGGAAGGVAGLVAVVAVNAAGVQMPPPPGAVSPIELRLAPHLGDFLLIVVVMAVVLGIAAIPPAVRAVRLKIVDALGHV